MRINEKKVIEDIERQEDILKDYYSFSKSAKEYRLQRQSRKLRLLIPFAVAYLIFAFGLLFIFKDGPNFLLWPIKFNAGSDSQEFKNLQSRLRAIDLEIKSIQGSLAPSTQKDPSLSYLNKKVTALEESIYLDPEKALTAVLLREKQKNLEDNFSGLRDSQVKLDSKVDNFVITVIVGPIILGFISFLIWLVQRSISKSSKKEE